MVPPTVASAVPPEEPLEGVVVEVVAEESAAARATAPTAPLAAASTVFSSARTEPVDAETIELIPRQAPQFAHGPSGQSPVGGSPDVVVAAAVVAVTACSSSFTTSVVVVVCTGSDWERSQMPSPLVST